MILILSSIEILLTVLLVILNLKISDKRLLMTFQDFISLIFIVFIPISSYIIAVNSERITFFNYLKFSSIIACLFLCASDFIQYVRNKDNSEIKKIKKRISVRFAVFVIILIIVFYYENNIY